MSFFLIAYGLLLLVGCIRQSLWLDEIIDLHQIRDLNLPDLIARIPVNAGGVPLNYLIRDASVHLLGYSPLSGRLPSLVFSILAALGILVLARQIRLRFPALAVVFLCLMPLQLRYGFESRPYSQALCIAVWATVVCRSQMQRLQIMNAVTYGLLAILGLYTQPYTLFVFCAHLLWIMLLPTLPRRNELLTASGLPVIAAAFVFLPWQLWTMSLWKQTMGQHERYTVGLNAIGVLLHELVGAGYIGTLLTISLAAIGFTKLDRGERMFWGACLFLPVALALIADKWFAYFFAARQLITVLAPLAVLAALGTEVLIAKSRVLGITCASLLIVTFLYANAQLLRKPHGDWRSASSVLQGRAGQGACIVFLPAGSAEFYSFFQPEITRFRCLSPQALPTQVLVAVAPYWDTTISDAPAALRDGSYLQGEKLTTQEPHVYLFIHK